MKMVRRVCGVKRTELGMLHKNPQVVLSTFIEAKNDSLISKVGNHTCYMTTYSQAVTCKSHHSVIFNFVDFLNSKLAQPNSTRIKFVQCASIFL